MDLLLAVAGSLDARIVVERLLDVCLGAGLAERATVSRFTPAGLTIVATVGRAGDVSWIGRTYDLAAVLRQPLMQRLFDTQAPVFGAGWDVSVSDPAILGALSPVKHTALVPILEDSTVAGVIVLSRIEGAEYTDADRPILSALGPIAGLAIRNSELYGEAEDAGRHLRAAVNAATAIGAPGDMPSLLTAVCGQAAVAVGADSASVMSLDGAEMVMDATTGVAPLGSRWPLPGPYMKRVMAGEMIASTQSEPPLDAPALEEEAQRIAARYEHSVIAPLRMAGDVMGALVVARRAGAEPFGDDDVDVLRHFASLAALVVANGRLLERVRDEERKKSDFMDVAVHELRSPLAVINGYVDLLLTGLYGDMPAAALPTLQAIARKAGEAVDLANGLLTLARLDSRDLHVDIADIDVAAAAEAAVTRARPSAGLSGASVRTRGDGPVHARADRELLDRILDNLIGNAIAYSGAGADVVIESCRTGDSVHVEVRDSGPGIDPEEAELIFDRFSRGRNGRDVPGTGLGLYVSRECAHRMGGELRLADSGPQGSTFRLELAAGHATA